MNEHIKLGMFLAKIQTLCDEYGYAINAASICEPSQGEIASVTISADQININHLNLRE